MADARVTALHRGERHEFRSPRDALAQILRLAWVSDAFLAQALYRAKARLQALGVPRAAAPGPPARDGDRADLDRRSGRVEPGVYIIHGQVVADGLVEIALGGRDRSVRYDRAAGRST